MQAVVKGFPSRGLQKVVLVILLVLAVLSTTPVLGYVVRSSLGMLSVGSTNAQLAVGSTNAWFTVGTLQSNYPDDIGASPVWVFAQVLVYVFVAICIILALMCIVSNNLVAGVIIAAVAIVVGIVGTSIIQQMFPRFW